jgi:NADPH2:quinone reductase
MFRVTGLFVGHSAGLEPVDSQIAYEMQVRHIGSSRRRGRLLDLLGPLPYLPGHAKKDDDCVLWDRGVLSMRAVVVDEPGGLDKLRVADVAEPEAGAGEVLIDVAFAACNWSDIQKRQGVYPDPIKYPAILGMEVSGRIARVGPGVRGFRKGQPVAAIVGPRALGGFAERVAIPQEFLIALPDGFDMRKAAAFPVVGLTAYHLLYTAHKVKRGETILIHAIGGALGLALTQLAVAADAKVLGTASSRAKADSALAYGASRVVVRDEADFVEVALEETGGRGVDLVIDSLGADILERSFDALRRYGRLINIGEAAGYPNFPIREKLYERSTSMAGFELLHAIPGSRQWATGLRKVVGGIADGTLEIPVAAEFPLSAIREAQAHLEGRGVSGKVLIDPSR